MSTIEKKRDRVAIVGFAGTTRHLAPYDDMSYEIWGLNEAHRQPWMKRITRWFQMHQQWDFTKQNNKSYREHWEWLQQEHPFPIYMQDKYPDVPSSVKFPVKEISEKYLSKVQRGKTVISGPHDTIRNDYFTSSFAFMCSLALYEGFKRIEVYGFEMATDTEYRYQKGSTEFWLGIAAGLGVEIYVPSVCRLLKAQLYGYEVSRMINRQRLEFLEKKFNYVLKACETEMNQINGRRMMAEDFVMSAKTKAEKTAYQQKAQDILQQEVDAMGKTMFNRGKVAMLKDLIKTVDNMHLGKDPGDGYVGTFSDIDEEAEEKAQEAAEEAAADIIGPSEG